MKEEAAERLAHAHYRIDPTLKLVRWLKASPELEADPEEPIKLLEVPAEHAFPMELLYSPHLMKAIHVAARELAV